MKQSDHQTHDAEAQLVVLALLSDGVLSRGEINRLERIRAYERLGIGRSELFESAGRLCARLHANSVDPLTGCARVNIPEMHAMMAQVRAPVRRLEVASLMFDLIRIDGRAHAGESLLLWEALDQWGLTLKQLSRHTWLDLPEQSVRAPRVFKRAAQPAREPAHA